MKKSTMFLLAATGFGFYSYWSAKRKEAEQMPTEDNQVDVPPVSDVYTDVEYSLVSSGISTFADYKLISIRMKIKNTGTESVLIKSLSGEIQLFNRFLATVDPVNPFFLLPGQEKSVFIKSAQINRTSPIYPEVKERSGYDIRLRAMTDLYGDIILDVPSFSITNTPIGKI